MGPTGSPWYCCHSPMMELHHLVDDPACLFRRLQSYHQHLIMARLNDVNLNGIHCIHRVFDGLHYEYFQCALICALAFLSNDGISILFLLFYRKIKEFKIFIIDSRCIEKWSQSLPKTVDVRLVAVMISAALDLLLFKWLPLLIGFGLRKTVSSVLVWYSLGLMRSSFSLRLPFGDALRVLIVSFRLWEI